MSRLQLLPIVVFASLAAACGIDESLGEPGELGADESAIGGAPDVAGRYIVVMRDGVATDARFVASYRQDARLVVDTWRHIPAGVMGAVQQLESRLGFRADRVYGAALAGFAARLDGAQLAALAADPDVLYVEPDGIATAIAQTLPWGINHVDADVSSTLAGNGSGTITNVRAYIIDTGIDTAHPDLTVAAHVNFAGGPNKDCNGHGTHVAGTVAAKDNASDVVGVAPGATLYGVKVLSCSGSGSYSGVISGIDWVTANAIKPAVANMSLGGGASQAVDDAVRNSAASGVFYALAAGNEGADACNSSPARAGAGTNNGIMTVGAIDSANKEASWSNYGACVDIWAPGVGVLSTKSGGGTTTYSGTSMASPHGAGGGALYLSSHTGASPSTVEAALKSAAKTPGTKSKDGRSITTEYVGGF
ncbi:MAG TPA: S8 family peptidase [Kofleriaceae bacterium]|nr:S8 family peptidase [Kofleriaceae bacterium]